MVTSLQQRWRDLYRQWLRRRIPPSPTVVLDQRRIFILPSAYGLLFLGVSAALFIAGINYENNLILAMSFFLVSLFVVGILHTFRNLAGVTLQAGGMRPGFAGASGALEVRLIPGGRKGHFSLWLSWPGSPDKEISVAPDQQQAVWLDVMLPRRGKVRPERLRIESRYPLGFFRAWSLVDLDHWCLAWPRPVASASCPAAGGDEDLGEHDRLHGNEDFQGLRGYVAGDSLRAIDWKSLARGRGLNTKMFVDPSEGRLWLEWDRLSGVDVETRLSQLCWWVLELERENNPYGLRMPGEELAPAVGPEQRQHALQMLALYGVP